MTMTKQIGYPIPLFKKLVKGDELFYYSDRDQCVKEIRLKGVELERAQRTLSSLNTGACFG